VTIGIPYLSAIPVKPYLCPIISGIPFSLSSTPKRFRGNGQKYGLTLNWGDPDGRAPEEVADDWGFRAPRRFALRIFIITSKHGAAQIKTP
jgi:hypothetical protein